MRLEEQSKLIRSSREVHKMWYRETYPDVNDLGMEPAIHYLLYGAAMGRNPGKNFDTEYYLRTYPDVAASGLNPLLHYVLHGKAKGYSKKAPKKTTELRRIIELRIKLLTLGFTEAPLAELSALAKTSEYAEVRTAASSDLALWHMRQKTDNDYKNALSYLRAAQNDASGLRNRQQLALTELLCYHFLGDIEGGYKTFDRALVAGELTTDLILASANLEPAAEARLFVVNRALAVHDIPPICALPDNGRSIYDRLSITTPLPKVNNGPCVTVLIAAYDAKDTLPTALRSLQEQTWQNLQIIVLDDCSPDNGATVRVAQKFADRDPRIRVIRMEKNGGAYVARNRGLVEATGKYVTLHDADDWSHPQKIELQVRFLEQHTEVMGCTSEQARATEDLMFPKWAGPHGAVVFCKENVSSFMQRHKPVFERVGYWDSVRFGADSEKMRRIRSAFGPDSVVSLKTGPLSFQRISQSSIVSDGAFGVDGYFFGARLAYFEGQLEQHERGVEYRNPENTNFPVPQVMRPDRKQVSNHFDVIILSEYRMHGGSTRSNIEEILCHKRFGLRTGIVQVNRYDYPPNKRILSEVRDVFDKETCVPISYGENVTCDQLIIRYPPVLEHTQRYVPRISAADIRVIVNQPPMSDYGPNGERRYHLDKCAQNIRAYFGRDAVWHPIGPLVREALWQHHSEELHHILLSDQDWSNIIDVDGWERARWDVKPDRPLRIGRHSRDSPHKWLDSASSILSAYPEASDVQIHVLGGAKSAETLIGNIPYNWSVMEFGSVPPKEFLSKLDVWIYFSHPNWLESFGRTIIEAMAVGVPVILPIDYKPLFKEAAIYATPETAVAKARSLCGNSELYNRQVSIAKKYVRDKFSYQMHINRLKCKQAN